MLLACLVSSCGQYLLILSGHDLELGYCLDTRVSSNKIQQKHSSMFYDLLKGNIVSHLKCQSQDHLRATVLILFKVEAKTLTSEGTT